MTYFDDFSDAPPQHAEGTWGIARKRERTEGERRWILACAVIVVLLLVAVLYGSGAFALLRGLLSAS